MSRLTVAVLLVAAATAGPRSASAGPDPAPPAASPQLAKETGARAKCADELAGLGKFCAMYSVFGDAKDAYAKAIVLDPARTAVFQAELDKLKDKTGTAQAGAAAQVADRRTKCLAKCTDLLAPPVAGYVQADRSADAARLFALAKSQGCSLDAALWKLDCVLFEPYLEWRRKKDADKLGAGAEFVDGAWVEPAKVAELNAAHAQWTSPWVLTDDVHELRTTLPLRTARQVLARVGAFRRFFLESFAGTWDLKQPDAKLPLVVTPTLAELADRLREADPGWPARPLANPAYYLPEKSAVGPCLVSLEVPCQGDKTVKSSLKEFWWTLQRRLTSQLAAEYSKHGADPGRRAQAHLWAAEGLSSYMPYYDLVDGSWVLTHPRAVFVGEGMGFDGAFAWCKANVSKIPPLGKFTALADEEIMTPENVRICATLTWFLLEGKDRAYRARFAKVLETVHQCREEPDTFVKCFDGVHGLDAEFRDFVKAIKVDGK